MEIIYKAYCKTCDNELEITKKKDFALKETIEQVNHIGMIHHLEHKPVEIKKLIVIGALKTPIEYSFKKDMHIEGKTLILPFSHKTSIIQSITYTYSENKAIYTCSICGENDDVPDRDM